MATTTIQGAIEALIVGLIVAAALGVCELILWIYSGGHVLDDLDAHLRQAIREEDDQHHE